MSWWVDLGYPSFEEEEGGFPRVGQVIRYYRERKRDDAGRAWTQHGLAEFLTVTEKAVWDIENRGASVDVDRRRRLSVCLDIPPVLLGIRTREEILNVVEERRAKQAFPLVSPSDALPMFWWVELGYHSFAPGKDGFFPRTGETVKYYRRQTMDRDGKPWSQRRLANVLGIETNQAVWNLENRDTALDVERRRFLCDLFDIPPLLFGIITLDEINRLVEQRRKAQSAIVVVSTPLATSRKLTIDVEEYTALLDNYWKTFLSSPTQISITNISLCVDALDRELPSVRDQKPLQELLCRFHDLAANLLLERQDYNGAMVHLEKALQFAQLLNTDELKVAVLYDYGYALRLAGRLDKALEKYEEARRYEQRLPNNLRGSLLLETGKADAQEAETPEEKNAAIALIDRIGNIIRRKEIERDPYFLNFSLDRYHLARSFSLIAVGRNRDALNELMLINGSSESPRRQVYRNILQAQAELNLGEYSEAARLATSGLVVAQEIDSKVNIARVDLMYKRFPRDLFKHDDEVARLEYLLSKRKKRSKR